MMLTWACRCLPGFSLIALALLLLLAFSDVLNAPRWKGVFVPPSYSPAKDGAWSSLSRAQQCFVVYAILVHLHMFGFTLRLSWSLFRVFKKTKHAFERRITETPPVSPASSRSSWSSRQDYSEKHPSESIIEKPSVMVEEIAEQQEVIHAIILPNYGEDLNTLETTLNVLASHPRAQSQYEIYLAMEQKEESAPEKAAKLTAAFEKSFLHVRSTFHPSGVQGEIAGKSSNVAFAARRIVEIHRADLKAEACNVIATVMDADTHLCRDYFTEIRRMHYAHLSEAERSIYCCPIIFDRNSHESPILVRCADLLWGFAGLSTMYPGSWLAIPTSVYSLPLSLAEKVGGWDSGPTAIGEDMHMLLKCYFETAGNVVSRVVYAPASQCNVSSDRARGWRWTLDTCLARYRQALRHMWGALDSGFAARRSISYLRFDHRCLFLRPRHFLLLHMLWEAHFLPCHLVILMVFSTAYTVSASATSLHPMVAWAFSVTNILRTMGFLWMNLCLVLYERWHALCLEARMQDMREARLADTGCSQRVWYKPTYLLERICFPVAGTLFGAVPMLHAVVSHFWTDRLVYRVSKKPTFSSLVDGVLPV
ncbi:uncharacterized protein PFLUO_LOCUS5721 [Penicillium psychrofluorescens]|uniref:uncharacterized protein n=1 Tax=Penicillium psychrofluorescens TaxID=3158075 RepID=UPI003CCD877B